MAAALHDVTAYSLQLLAIIAAAGIGLAVSRVPSPRARAAFWRGILVLCLFTPLLPSRAAAPSPAPTSRTRRATAPIDTAVRPLMPVRQAVAPAMFAFRPFPSARVPWPAVVLAALAGGVLARIAWLAAGLLGLKRLRRGSVPFELPAPLRELVERIAPAADVRVAGTVRQPMTFGLRRPLILLPPGFATLDEGTQRAALAHELFHVKQWDWSSLVVEEVVRSLFWFHPAMRWAIGQLQLSREQIADSRAAAVAGRRIYVEALLLFAGERIPAPAMGFAPRRHLSLRLRSLLETRTMSSARTSAYVAALALIVGTVTIEIVAAVPLVTTASLWRPSSPFHSDRDLAIPLRTEADIAFARPVQPVESTVPPVVAAAARTARESTDDPLAELARVGETYRAFGSYTGHGWVFGGGADGREVTVEVEVSTARRPSMTPDHLRLDQLTAHIATVRRAGVDILYMRGAPTVCDRIDARYVDTGDTVRYWIEQTTHLVWRLDITPDASGLDAPAPRTVTFGNWSAPRTGFMMVGEVDEPLGILENGRYRHLKTGITFDIPEEWRLVGTVHSSDDGEMAQFTDRTREQGISIWMKANDLGSVGVRAQLRAAIPQKIAQRQGFRDYWVPAETIRLTTIGGVQALIATAAYLESDTPMSECLTWIVSRTERAFVFARVPTSSLAAFEPRFREIADSGIVP